VALVDGRCRADEPEVRSLRAALLDPEGGSFVLPAQGGEGTWLLGGHQAGEGTMPAIRALAFADSSKLQSGDLSGAGLTLRLFEEAGAQGRDFFKGAWEHFLSLMNLLQFAQHADFVTSKGLADHIYGSMLKEFLPAKAEEMGADSAGLEELLAYADERLGDLLRRVASQELPLPVTGFELLDGEGTITGTAELGWEHRRVAILAEGDEASKEAFLKSGWTVFELKEAVLNLEQIIMALK
jgi:hypothetical protein